MKIKSLVLIVFIGSALLTGCTPNDQHQLSDMIKINQLGYFPDGVKTFVVVDTAAIKFELINTKGKKVFEGNLSGTKFWEPSGEYLQTGDFSDFKDTGTYMVVVKNLGSSYPFKIGSDIYKEALKASLKSYYYIRASMEILPEYGDIYSRPMAHPDTQCYFHETTGYPAEDFISSPGGWYDAGDYNKYIVNGGITNATMLDLYELYPDVVTDNYTNIPESNNGISDLLDEVKYELDWFLTMQDKDGGVFFKLTTKNFEGFVKPVEAVSPRFIMKKATASALGFAANMAQASRIYKKIDPELAGKYLTAAEKAWKWAVTNDKVYYRNPEDVHTGEYGDDEILEEFFWTAAELYITTNSEEYKNYVQQNWKKFQFFEGDSWRRYLQCLAYYSLYTNGYAAEFPEIEPSIISEADKLLEESKDSPYGNHQFDYEWASNCDVVNQAMIYCYAYQISKEKKYYDAILESLDYIFGKNATGYSFLTGFGGKPSKHPHNRLIDTDEIDDPIPGFLVGGPNFYKHDLAKVNEVGLEYPAEPAKCYIDHVNSFASNETCINWNAPLIFVLGFVEKNK
ncbi:MAG: glycoside hydrolase family 9 protein [Bacteroidales bacterium]|nr:glycoside hydrolase family 9 protein [Bacteroidales bacterium]